MTDPTAHAKLIERLRNAADWCRKVGTEDNGDLYDEAADMIESLAAAPGLVPLPEKMPRMLSARFAETGMVQSRIEAIWDEFRSEFATPAPLAAQSEELRELKAQYADLLSEARGLSVLVDTWCAGAAQSHDQAIVSVGMVGAALDTFGMPPSSSAMRKALVAALEWQAKHAAQSPPPRAERIERSGKDRRSEDWGGPVNRTGKDRRARPQSGERTFLDNLRIVSDK